MSTTIDANQSGNGFILNSGEGTETVIRDLVLTGAMATNASALYLDHSTCSIINCLITGNHSNLWGTVGFNGATGLLVIQDCTFTSNERYGVAAKEISLGNYTGEGDLVVNIDGCKFLNGGVAININFAGDISIQNCEFSGSNQYGPLTGEGSKINFYRCDSATLTNCLIADNEIAWQWGNGYGSGGGINVLEVPLTIQDCVIRNNKAGMGGGVLIRNTSCEIIDSVIQDNWAMWGNGGGILLWNSTCTVTGTTIHANFASPITPDDCEPGNPECSPPASGGGGIGFFDWQNPSELTLVGSTLCQNVVHQIWGSNGEWTADENTYIGFSCLGGCCIDNTCLPTLEYVCDNAGGTWQGIGSNCENADCPPAEPTGACCVSSGCVANNNDDCTALGGTWLGEGGSCDDCPASCMGDTDSNGVVNIEDLLNMIGSWGACP